MRRIALYLLLLMMLWSTSSFAADLIDVYCQALKCDPTFNGAIADLMTTREDIPINRALLLPRLDIHADVERQRVHLLVTNTRPLRDLGLNVPPTIDQSFYNTSINYYLKLSQPVFNYTNWSKLQRAKATVKQGEATFCYQAQNLQVRIVKAYFDILIADANLFYDREQKKAVAEQLRAINEEFKVGVVPITDLYEAQANFDLIVAQEITDQYFLATKIETLRTITNKLYCSLQGLGAYLPLVTPNPGNINAWVCIAEKQNYQLLAARYAAGAARENIRVQSGDKYPAINVFTEYSFTKNTNLFEHLGYEQKILEGGAELNWAPIQGGGILARTAQARFEFLKSCQDEEYTHRQIVMDARNSYLGIFANIAKVKADRAAVASNQKSLEATIQSYQAGTRTILDVLNQEAQFYNSEKVFIQDRYQYIYQTVLLKQAAGTLSVCDLQHINTWLYKQIDISKADALLDGCLVPSTGIR